MDTYPDDIVSWHCSPLCLSWSAERLCVREFFVFFVGVALQYIYVYMNIYMYKHFVIVYTCTSICTYRAS